MEGTYTKCSLWEKRWYNGRANETTTLFRAIGDTERAHSSRIFFPARKCVETIKQDKNKLRANPLLNMNKKIQ